MGFASGCLRCILAITNIILLFIGLICLGFGVFMMVGLQRLVNDFLEPSLKNVKDMSKQFDYNSTVSNAVNRDDGSGEIDIMPLVEPVAICLIVVGIILLIVAIFGVCGACCNSRVLLAIPFFNATDAYAIVLTVVILVQLILIIVFFTKGLDGRIRDRAESSLIKPYQGVNDYSASSLAANALMYQFKCCGIDNYEDFSVATDWKKTYQVTRNGVTKNVELKIPMSCCKTEKSTVGAGSSDEDGNTVRDQFCAEHPTDVNSNWKTGCWGEITSELEQYRSPAIGATVVILIVQVVFVVVAVAIIFLLKDNKVL